MREANLVALAVDRPEIGLLHLAGARPAGLDRHLVHRLDTAGPYRLELRIADRFEQRHGRLHQLRQPGPADADALIVKPAVLAVQRQVVVELVDHPCARGWQLLSSWPAAASRDRVFSQRVQAIVRQAHAHRLAVDEYADLTFRIRPPRWSNSHRACGRRCSRPIRCAPIFTNATNAGHVNNAFLLPVTPARLVW